jgi:D-alanyl-D-alanine carboxypeptidase
MRGWMAALLAMAVAWTPGASWAKPTSGLARTIAAYAAAHEFSGTIVVRHSGVTLYQHAFGLADRSFGVPAALTTRYRIASITKQFAATMVLQLQEEGRLSLKAPVTAYLPDWHGPPGVTIESLLGHTSGLANMDTVTSYEEAATKGIPAYQAPHSPAELVRLYASGPAVRPVGQAFDYNNADYMLLGRVIETVTGDSFEAELHKRILDPLGLRDTGMLVHSRITPRLAPTYYRPVGAKALIADLPVYEENWYAAGGMYATTADLAAFADALYAGRLLKPESLKRMLTPGLGDYGCGLWVRTLKAGGRRHPTAERYGSIMGANGILFRVLDEDLTVAVLANTNAVDMGDFAVVATRAVLGD